MKTFKDFRASTVLDIEEGAATVLKKGLQAGATAGAANAADSKMNDYRDVASTGNVLATRAVQAAAEAPRVVAAAPRAAKLASTAAEFTGLGKGLLGKAAWPVAAGLAAYDAYRGYNAQPNASVSTKLKNAGQNAISGITFGLVPKPAGLNEGKPFNRFCTEAAASFITESDWDILIPMIEEHNAANNDNVTLSDVQEGVLMAAGEALLGHGLGTAIKKGATWVAKKGAEWLGQRSAEKAGVQAIKSPTRNFVTTANDAANWYNKDRKWYNPVSVGKSLGRETAISQLTRPATNEIERAGKRGNLDGTGANVVGATTGILGTKRAARGVMWNAAFDTLSK